jgi:tetratricopeptide (TPR) repeat protein
VLVSLGNAYLNTGQDDKALAAYDKAVQIMPNPGMWNNIAYELGTHKAHFERALQYAESAVSSIATALRNTDVGRITMTDLGNTNLLAASWDTLGWVYFHKGDLANAERYIHAAWLMSEHGEVGDHLAQVYEKQGRRDDALRMYALALNGERPLAETRGKLVKLAGGEKQAEALVEKHKETLKQQRTVRLKSAGAKGNADFLVLVASGGTDVKFASGDESLKTYAQAIGAAKLPITFPDQRPAKLLRRGKLTCDQECAFVLLRPDEVTSLD